MPEKVGQRLVLPALQIVYAALGLAELGCVMVLLGLFSKGPCLSRRFLHAGEQGEAR